MEGRLIESGNDRQLWPLTVIWLLLIVAAIPWRQGEYFEGGLDAVVIAKAALQMFAFILAVLAYQGRKQLHQLGGYALILFALFIAISLIGALSSGDFQSSAILAIRLTILAATIVILARSYAPLTLISSLMIASAMVGVASAATGLPEFLSGERLGSKLPPLSPNAVSMLVGIPALGALHELVHGRRRMAMSVLLLLFCAIMLATGSRSALAAFCVAAVFVMLYLRKIPFSLASAVLLLVPIIFAVLAFSPILERAFARSSAQGSNLTLNSRTIAWNVVFQIPYDSWQKWLGEGLAVKTVPVVGQYWDKQVLDSSWISALAQAGLLGTAFLLLLAFVTCWHSLRRGPLSSIATPLLAFVLIRSVLENGLTEPSPAFMVFFLLALLLSAPRLPAKAPQTDARIETRRTTAPAS